MPLNRYWDSADWQHVDLTVLRPGDTLRVAGAHYTVQADYDGRLVAVAPNGRRRWLGTCTAVDGPGREVALTWHPKSWLSWLSWLWRRGR